MCQEWDNQSIYETCPHGPVAWEVGREKDIKWIISQMYKWEIR